MSWQPDDGCTTQLGEATMGTSVPITTLLNLVFWCGAAGAMVMQLEYLQSQINAGLEKGPLSLGQLSDIQRPVLTMPIHALLGGLAGVMLGLHAVVCDLLKIIPVSIMAGANYKSVLANLSKAGLLIKLPF
ncbi:hypothetical protein [Xanthomonas euvesicatoria]|uniref:hypothetical protein n=1 Tax=Xanthomonas euvesicatoria TaxID=456327 RepID=UPI001C470DCA|nr:hypothetical protein [Xanthomonas euvesicatoria]MBV6799643.1 hypothetical protein [Xanthomonas campestris pv. obscurae]